MVMVINFVICWLGHQWIIGMILKDLCFKAWALCTAASLLLVVMEIDAHLFPWPHSKGMGHKYVDSNIVLLIMCLIIQPKTDFRGKRRMGKRFYYSSKVSLLQLSHYPPIVLWSCKWSLLQQQLRTSDSESLVTLDHLLWLFVASFHSIVMLVHSLCSPGPARGPPYLPNALHKTGYQERIYTPDFIMGVTCHIMCYDKSHWNYNYLCHISHTGPTITCVTYKHIGPTIISVT